MVEAVTEVTKEVKEVMEKYVETCKAKYGGAKRFVVMALYWELKEMGGNESDIGLFLDNVDRLTLDKKLVELGGDILTQIYPGTTTIGELRERMVNKQYGTVVKEEEVVSDYRLPASTFEELVKAEWLGVDATGKVLEGFRLASEDYSDVLQVLLKNHPKDEADAVSYFKENCRKYYEFVYEMGTEPDRKDLVEKYVIMSDTRLNDQFREQPKDTRMVWFRTRAGLPAVNVGLMDYLVSIVPKKDYEEFYKSLVFLPFDKLKEETDRVAENWLAIGKKTNKVYTLREYKYGYLYRKVNGKMANMCYPVTNVFYMGDLGTLAAEVTPKREILASGGTERDCVSLGKLFKGEAVRVREVDNLGKELMSYLDVSNGESFKKLLFRLESLINKKAFNDLIDVLTELPELTVEQENQIQALVK